MPSPLWTALPPRLDLLLGRMLDVQEYPVIGPSKARCGVSLIVERAPDPHDWRLWRTGTFLASYDARLLRWPLYLRRCAACSAIEVRKEGDSVYVASARKGKTTRTPGPADVLLGWYQA